jgi:hypothetical protein
VQLDRVDAGSAVRQPINATTAPSNAIAAPTVKPRSIASMNEVFAPSVMAAPWAPPIFAPIARAAPTELCAAAIDEAGSPASDDTMCAA